MESRTEKIAVTVVTGFLGSGKTTFINRLLANYNTTQFALVENEFGEISIDTKLIKGVDASQMFELREGCICCTITDEYELVLQELAERFPNVEHLLIETTGIAEPTSVIRPFFRDENLKEIYSFKGTICLVDAINYDNQPEPEIVLKQIAVADQVLINKSENLSDSKKEQLKSRISNINTLCEIQFAKFGSPDDFELNDLLFTEKILPDTQITKQNHAQIATKTLVFNTPLNKEKFTDWLSYQLDIYKNEIYRVKGILCFEKEPYEFILQGVGGSFEITEGENLCSATKSEIVLIGNIHDKDFAFESI